jgi:hypothetical protein
MRGDSEISAMRLTIIMRKIKKLARDNRSGECIFLRTDGKAWGTSHQRRPLMKPAIKRRLYQP